MGFTNLIDDFQISSTERLEKELNRALAYEKELRAKANSSWLKWLGFYFLSLAEARSNIRQARLRLNNSLKLHKVNNGPQ